MDSVILIIISTCIFLPYIIYQYRKKGRQKQHIKNVKQLHQVEAGPTKHLLSDLFNKKIDLMPMVNVNMEGISIDPELEYFVVKNQCMQIKGISDGDIVGVRMFNEVYNMPTSFKKGRMLLIFLDDEHFKGYKIREQGEITNDRTGYNTYHYKDGVKNKSSKPHSIDSIKGIVVEVHQRRYISSMN